MRDIVMIYLLAFVYLAQKDEEEENENDGFLLFLTAPLLALNSFLLQLISPLQNQSQLVSHLFLAIVICVSDTNLLITLIGFQDISSLVSYNELIINKIGAAKY